MIGDDCLISSTASGSNGVLFYDGDEKTIQQKYTVGYYWNNFVVIGNKACISSTTSYGVGILLYDGDSGLITQTIPTGHYWTKHTIEETQQFVLSSNQANTGLVFCDAENIISHNYTEGSNYKTTFTESGVIFAGVDRIVFYDYETQQLSTLSDAVGSWIYFAEINGRYAFRSSGAVALYDIRSGSIVAWCACPSGTNITTVKQLDQRYYIMYNNSSGSTNVGIVIHDAEKNTLSLGYDKGNCWSNAVKCPNGWVISSTSSNSVNVGMLFLDAETGEMTKIGTIGYAWERTAKIDEHILISSSSSNGTYICHAGLNSITQLTSSGNETIIKNQKIDEDSYILYSASITGFYSLEADSLTKWGTSGANWDTLKTIGNKCIIKSSSSSNNDGIYLYDPVPQTAYQISTSGKTYVINALNEHVYLVHSTTSGNVNGFYIIDTNLNTVACMTTGYNWNTHQAVGGGFLISSSTSSGEGIYFYNTGDGSVKKVYASGYNWDIRIAIGSNCLISSTSSSNIGVLLYDSSAKTVTQKYATGYNWNMHQVVGSHCIMSSSSGGVGVLFYDSSAKTVDLRYSTSSNWNIYQMVGDNCIISSTSGSNTGVLVYTASSKALAWKYASGTAWNIVYVVGSNCLIASSSSSTTGILRYKGSDGSVTKKYSSLYNWNIYQSLGASYCVISSTLSSNTGILIYSSSGDSITRNVTTGYNWSNILAYKNACFIRSVASSSYGVYYCTGASISQVSTSNSTLYIDDVSDTIKVVRTSDSSGFWVVDTLKDTIIRGSTTGNDWTAVNAYSRCFLFSTTTGNTGILMYDSTTGEITTAVNYGINWRFICKIGNKLLVSADDSSVVGAYLLNAQTLSLTRVVDTGYNWNLSCVIGNDVLLSSTISSNTGIIRCDVGAETSTKIYDSEYGWETLAKTDDFATLASSASSNCDILLYNSKMKSIVVCPMITYMYDVLLQVEDNCIISSSSSDSSYKGAYLYNVMNETFTFCNVGYQYDISRALGNDCLIESSTNASTLIYDSDAKSIKQSSISGSKNYDIVQQVERDFILTSSTTYSGVLLYNALTKSLGQAYASGTKWTHLQMIGNDCLISSSNSVGVLLYDSATKKVIQRYSYGTWGYYQIVGANCLIGADGSTEGVLVYDSSSKTVSEKYGSGIVWDQFEVLGDGCIITSSSTSNKNTLFYKNNSVTFVSNSKCTVVELGNLHLLLGSNNTAIYNLDTLESGVFAVRLSADMTQTETKNGLLLYHPSYLGVLYINMLTEKPMALATSGSYKDYYKIGSTFFISGASNGNVVIFDEEDDNNVNVNAGYAYTNHVSIKDTDAICVSGAGNAIIYDTQKKTATSMAKSGRNYTSDDFFKYGDKYFIINTATDTGVLEYNPETNVVRRLFPYGNNYSQIYDGILVSDVKNSLTFHSYDTVTRQRAGCVNGLVYGDYIYNTAIIQSLKSLVFQVFTFPYDIPTLIEKGVALTTGSIVKRVFCE